MDRNTFLRCQPYLYPLPSSSAPDAETLGPSVSSLLDSSGTNRTKCSREILLAGVSLSIEPCDNSTSSGNSNSNSNSNNDKTIDDRGNTATNGENAGAAYFAPTTPASTRTSATSRDDSGKAQTDGSEPSHASGDTVDRSDNSDRPVAAASFDPALCKIELSLHTAKLPEKGMTTPVKKTNRRSLSEIDDRVVATDEAIVIANIDGNYFQIDLNQVLGIVVGPSVTQNNHSSLGINGTNEARDGTKQNSTVRETPAYLLLEFPSCSFRLFSQKPLSNAPSDDETVIGSHHSTEETYGNRAMFDAVRSKLLNFLSIDCLLPFPLSYSGLTARSGQEPDSEAVHGQGGENNDNDNCSDPIGCARRCLWSYSQSWKDLAAFDNALENPLAARPSNRSTETKNFKDIVNRFMSEIPKQVASSFIEGDKWKMALESYNDKLCAKKQAFESLIDDVWTETSGNGRSAKRRRVSEDLASDGSRETGKTDCMNRYVELLKEHKRHIVSKHEMYLLPLRG
mmetsp:Transcript_24898/g.68641  ORF Transcript_24898/g.68641 Transcript_24898/m.68641 type:complete len:511 (+) Transcript_24898:141-1673(+)